jgi:hypothetical protein
MIYAWVLVQVLDVVSTVLVLRQGGTEQNPVIAWLMRRLGWGWIAVKLATGIGGGLLMVRHGYEAYLPVLIGVFAAVVIHNLRQLRR